MPDTPQLPEDFPPVIFPGQPMPTGLGKDTTPAEEKTAQMMQDHAATQQAIHAPDKREATDAPRPGLLAAIAGDEPKAAAPTAKDKIADMLDKETANAPLSTEEVQQLRELIYQAHQINKGRFNLPELPIADKDRDFFADCVLERRPYKETFSLMKGKLKVTIREKFKNETDEIHRQLDQHFAEGHIRNEAGFSTFIQNYSLLFQLVEINATPVPPVIPTPRPADWNLADAAKRSFLEKCSDHTMFMLISLMQQFEQKVRRLAQEVLKENFSLPAAGS